MELIQRDIEREGLVSWLSGTVMRFDMNKENHFKLDLTKNDIESLVGRFLESTTSQDVEAHIKETNQDYDGSQEEFSRGVCNLFASRWKEYLDRYDPEDFENLANKGVQFVATKEPYRVISRLYKGFRGVLKNPGEVNEWMHPGQKTYLIRGERGYNVRVDFKPASSCNTKRYLPGDGMRVSHEDSEICHVTTMEFVLDEIWYFVTMSGIKTPDSCNKTWSTGELCEPA